MNCTEYVSLFSDYVDGLLPDSTRERLDRHHTECETCRRYAAVFEQGAKLLQALPEPELSEDFVPRLQHRLYNVDEATDPSGGSATPALTVVGMAILLTGLAWTPILVNDAPMVVMEPIVVDEAPPAEVPDPQRPVQAMPGDLPKPEPLSEMGGLFEDGQALMYQYSPLSQRYRQRAAVRKAGLQRDR